MVKRAKKNKEAGEAFKKLLKDKGFSQYKLEQVTGIDKSVISKIVNGYTAEPKLETLEKIAAALGVELLQLTEIFTSSNTNSSHSSTNPQPQELDSDVSTFKNPDFLGREKDIKNLNNLVNQDAKVILIKAEGGIGKTTLAKNWFEIQGLEYLKLSVGTTSENLNSVEDWVRSKLRDDFKVNPANNFMTMLEQFKTELQKQKIGIFIDNLEPALKNGEFIETHRLYVDLLGVLTDKNIQTITLITSREQIHEYKIEYKIHLGTFHNYELDGLSEETWQEYFESKEIKIDNNSLNAIWRNYGGNAFAMELITAKILTESKGDLKAYWQYNSKNLLKHRSLKQLVQCQFDKLLNDNQDAYNLLCRLGVYPNQNINLPKMWLSCLLWNLSENIRDEIIDDLLSRCLLKEHGEDYYLHPVIKVEATERFSFIDERHDTNLISIKSQVDLLVASSHKFQNFLEWLYQKFLLALKKYRNSAFRAFYLGFIICYNCNLYISVIKNEYEYYELACKLDKSFYFYCKIEPYDLRNDLEELEIIFIKYADSNDEDDIKVLNYFEPLKKEMEQQLNEMEQQLKEISVQQLLKITHEIDTELLIAAFFEATILDKVNVNKIRQELDSAYSNGLIQGETEFMTSYNNYCNT